MKKITSIILLAITLQARAQDRKTLDSIDKVIITEIINPVQKEARENKLEPNWQELRQIISDKYNPVQADRAVTKAKIYSSFNRDWPTFTACIVHYTDAYEDKEDGRLMNKNAQFILQHSGKLAEWKAAAGWIKHAVDKEPGNTTYKATYDSLLAKIAGN